MLTLLLESSPGGILDRFLHRCPGCRRATDEDFGQCLVLRDGPDRWTTDPIARRVQVGLK